VIDIKILDEGAVGTVVAAAVAQLRSGECGFGVEHSGDVGGDLNQIAVSD
jgi:hypothetical protein